MISLSTVFKHKLLRHSFVYTASGVIRNAIPFLLLPVLTRYLTPADFGVVATFEVILAMALVFVGLNLHGAIAVSFFQVGRPELEIYVGNVILISAVSCVATFVVFGVLGKVPFAGLVTSPLGWAPVIAVAAFSQSLFSIALTLWQVEQKPLPYGIFQVLQTTVNVALSLVFVIVFGMGWQGRLLGIVISSMAFGGLSLFIIHRRQYVQFRINRAHIRDALFFGLPLVPHALGGWILMGIDRFFITSMVSVAATGIYSVGYQVGMIVGLVATSFNQAWSPFLFEKLNENNRRTKINIVKFTYMYDVGIVALALAVSLVAPLFLAVFVGPAFRGASQYVFWVALGYAANGMYFMVANYIFYVKKTYVLAWITLLSAIINVMLNYVLIKANGAIGAAQATTISFFISFILTWILSARVYKMPWWLWGADGANSEQSQNTPLYETGRFSS